MNNTFPTDYNDIVEKTETIEVLRYGKTRNYIDGAVTRLSPYISRGVISTRYVLESVLSRNYDPKKIEKFIRELAWRDYWQQVWVEKGDEINTDLKQPQPDVINYEIPRAILYANTGIQAIDSSIREFYESGYLHNHVRMYIASLACNIGGSHWKNPARWMYYNLLDGDWASNALSWQWVAGANSHKKYYANQENINRFCYTRQKGSFLDVEYETLGNMNIPEELRETLVPSLKTNLPETKNPEIDHEKPVLLYNFYNMDPAWKKEEDANRILILEPSIFEKYPVSDKSINFVLKLGQNIPGLKVFTGEFNQLQKLCKNSEFVYKEHPLNRHYTGKKENRDWMFSVKGYYRSFFAFWKKCSKELYI